MFEDTVLVNIQKSFRYLCRFNFCLGVLAVSPAIPGIPIWLVFVSFVCVIAVYRIFFYHQLQKSDGEIFMLLLLRDVAMNRIGNKDEDAARFLLSKMSVYISPSIEWVTKQHPGYCHILANVAQKMLDEQTRPAHWTDENLSQLLAELKKHSW